MSNHSAPLRAALVVAAYAGSDNKTTSHELVDKIIPRLAALQHANVQIFVYVHCDESENVMLVPTRVRHAELRAKYLLRGHVRGHLPPAQCNLGSAWSTVCTGTRCSVEFLPNLGREAHVYLHHMIRVYADPGIADLTLFVQEGEAQGLDRLLECATGLRRCPEFEQTPLASPGSLYWFAPITSSLTAILAKTDARIPDRRSTSWSGSIEPLLRACGEPPGSESINLSSKDAWWAADMHEQPGCKRPGSSSNASTDSHRRGEHPLDVSSAARVHDKVAATLVFHQPSICAAAKEMFAPHAESAKCHRIAGRGAFVAHSDAIRRVPYSLLAALYAMSTSEEVVAAHGRLLTPCSAACFSDKGRYLRINCGEWMLAGDAVAYILEALWPLLFEATARSDCRSLDGNCVPQSDTRKAKGGLWCPRPLNVNLEQLNK